MNREVLQLLRHEQLILKECVCSALVYSVLSVYHLSSNRLIGVYCEIYTVPLVNHIHIHGIVNVITGCRTRRFSRVAIQELIVFILNSECSFNHFVRFI